VSWVAAGANQDANGWLIRCSEEGIFVMEVSCIIVMRLIDQLEVILARPVYDQSIVFLDGFFLDVLVVRDRAAIEFDASNAEKDDRLFG
jgi:hypothetical protein